MTEYVTYGEAVPNDDELGLLGDVSGGRRVIELGIADNNSIALAQRGAKAIAVDPDPERLTNLRVAAGDADVSVECHEGDLGDLGFAPSGTIDVVLAVHTLDDVDDLGRILRQVHRVLKPGAPFVLVLDHPFAAVGPTPKGKVRRYGEDGAPSANCSPPSTAPTSAWRASTSSASVGVRCPDHPRREGPQARLLVFRPHSCGDLGGGCGAEASPEPPPADRSGLAGRSARLFSAGRWAGSISSIGNLRFPIETVRLTCVRFR